MKWWNMRQARKEAYVEIPQWEADYKLGALPDHHMFWEYLEVGECIVLIQFQFRTISSTAQKRIALFHYDVTSQQIYCLNAKNHGHQRGYSMFRSM